MQAPQRRVDRPSGAPDRRKLFLILFAAAGIVALAAVIAVIAVAGGGSSGSSDLSVAATMRAAGCTFTSAKSKSHEHVSSLNAKVKYNTFPPSNGNHYGTPAVWGFYTEAVNPLQVVHNEEHGGVILWWGPQTPQSEIDELHSFYQSSPNGMLGTPIAGLGDKVAITAWSSPEGGKGVGKVAVCPRFDEKAFTTFRDAYRGKGRERAPLDELVPGSS